MMINPEGLMNVYTSLKLKVQTSRWCWRTSQRGGRTDRPTETDIPKNHHREHILEFDILGNTDSPGGKLED